MNEWSYYLISSVNKNVNRKIDTDTLTTDSDDTVTNHSREKNENEVRKNKMAKHGVYLNIFVIYFMHKIHYVTLVCLLFQFDISYTQEDCPKPQNRGRRVVDIDHFVKQLLDISTHGPLDHLIRLNEFFVCCPGFCVSFSNPEPKF